MEKKLIEIRKKIDDLKSKFNKNILNETIDYKELINLSSELKENVPPDLKPLVDKFYNFIITIQDSLNTDIQNLRSHLLLHHSELLDIKKEIVMCLEEMEKNLKKKQTFHLDDKKTLIGIIITILILFGVLIGDKEIIKHIIKFILAL